MKTKEELMAVIKVMEQTVGHLPEDQAICVMAATDAMKWAAGYPCDSERLYNFYKGMEIALELAKD